MAGSRASYETLGAEAHSRAPLHKDGSGSVASVSDYEADAEYRAWQAAHPCALADFPALLAAARGRRLAVFLDYDGTLTPIVSDPAAAHLPPATRAAVRALAALVPVAIVSGRGRAKVQQFVRLRELFYAGSHGMDIAGPAAAGGEGADGSDGSDGDAGDAAAAFQPAAAFEPLMRLVAAELAAAVAPFPGAAVEDNRFCLSVHFRNCAPSDAAGVAAAVAAVAGRRPGELRVTRGRKVLEVRPALEWDKGAALVHLLRMLGLLADGASAGEDAGPAAPAAAANNAANDTPPDVFCIYLGDDRTDEDAFRVLAARGLGAGVLVASRAKPTAARWALRDPAEVAAFLERLVEWGRSEANVWHASGGCRGWTCTGGRGGAGAGGAAAAADA